MPNAFPASATLLIFAAPASWLFAAAIAHLVARFYRGASFMSECVALHWRDRSLRYARLAFVFAVAYTIVSGAAYFVRSL
jgi:hypothetical protein